MSSEISEEELRKILQKKLIEAYLDYAVLFGVESANQVLKELNRRSIKENIHLW